MSLSMGLEFLDYSPTDVIRDCMNDETEWINLTKEWKNNPNYRKYEKELNILLEKYKGLPLEKIILDNNPNISLIENIGIKPCERYPTKKCAFIKPFYCKDKYSSNKTDNEILDSSFFGILDHRFYETRRINNPFARKQTTRTGQRNTRKLFLPVVSSSSVPILKNTTRAYSRKKAAEINDLIKNIRTLQLSLPDNGRNSQVTRSNSRSRVINNTATSSPRKTRSKSRARNA